MYTHTCIYIYTHTDREIDIYIYMQQKIAKHAR